MRIRVIPDQPDAAEFAVELPAVPRAGELLALDKGGELPAMYRVKDVYWNLPPGGVSLSVKPISWPAGARR